MLAAWGRLVFRRRGVVLVICLALLVLAAFGLWHGGPLTTGTIHGVEADEAGDLAKRALGDRAGPTFVALFRSDTLTVDDPSFYADMGEALAPLDGDPQVASILSPVEAPPRIGEALVSTDRHAALAVVVMKGELTTAELGYAAVRAKIRPGKFHVSFTGELQYRLDLDSTLKHDLFVAEIVSLPLALLVLLVVFRSVIAATMPVIVGGLSVLGAISFIVQLARYTEMARYTINVASLIGLGLAIDYSLFYTSRFREELAGGASVARAIEIAMATAGQAVLGSGLAAAVGLSGLVFFPRSYVSAMGLAGGVVVLASVASALTLLPAVLAMLGPRVDAIAIGRRAGPEDGRLWRRLVPVVMKRPLLVLLPTLALMLALGVPFLRLEAAAAYVRVLPMSTEARATYEELLRDFPEEAKNRITVVVQFPTEELTADRVRALFELRERLAAIPHVAGTESVFDFDKTLDPEQAQKLVALPESLRPFDVSFALDHTSGHGIHVIQVLTPQPKDDAARSVVRAIRKERAVGDGKLSVTGVTALDVDSNDFFAAHAPKSVAFVAGLTYLLLLLLFRSLLLPLKAVLTNVLSITASFGALVWIFQEGHLAHLLRFEPGPVEPTLPVLLFCVVFGLSMDYEVLLLSRMREEWRKSHDNARAVTEGLARSGRLITSAAAIMVSVFAAFSLATVIMVKAMGVGMAIAVALDATVVRSLLVPAAMKLFGDWNWWVPAFMREEAGD
ncbi:MAG TPA: MMPL family transporter [Polyangiaceae bacterium]|nr:MMPL family transporter [Polyangiaceae bacterium]